jgi:H+-translocating NAD(P) transhydrogenase subunit alpha
VSTSVNNSLIAAFLRRGNRPVTILVSRCAPFALGDPMSAETATTFLELYVFVLAGFVGFQLITRVPPLLHTPLMSATNAISGISLVGSLVVAGGSFDTLATVLGFIAVTAATINVVGGFMITDRMLKMFKRQDRDAS